jgi:hypothetical protein
MSVISRVGWVCARNLWQAQPQFEWSIPTNQMWKRQPLGSAHQKEVCKHLFSQQLVLMRREVPGDLCTPSVPFTQYRAVEPSCCAMPRATIGYARWNGILESIDSQRYLISQVTFANTLLHCIIWSCQKGFKDVDIPLNLCHPSRRL